MRAFCTLLILLLLPPAAAQARDEAEEQCRLSSGDVAIKACTAWIAKKPDAYEGYYWRGIEHAEKEKHDLAIADYGKALAIAPDYVDALRARAFSLRATGKREAALEDLKRAEKLKPDDPNIKRALRDYGETKP